MMNNLKKALALLVIMSFMFLIPGDSRVVADETIAVPNKVIVFKIGDKNYYEQEVGKEARKVAMDVAPYIDKARTYVPVRYLGNALGVGDEKINWDNGTRTAILKGKHELKLTIGNQKMLKDNTVVEMDVAPQVIPPGRTMLPARYVAEGLGFKVEWDSERKLVIAYPEGQEKPNISQILKLLGEEEVRVVEIPASTDAGRIDKFEVKGYKIWVTNIGVHNPGIWFSISDESGLRQDIRVECVSHPEWNQREFIRWDGKYNILPTNVWNNPYCLFKDGYSPVNPKSGDRVVLDIYGKVDGKETKLLTVVKVLPPEAK